MTLTHLGAARPRTRNLSGRLTGKNLCTLVLGRRGAALQARSCQAYSLGSRLSPPTGDLPISGGPQSRRRALSSQDEPSEEREASVTKGGWKGPRARANCATCFQPHLSAAPLLEGASRMDRQSLSSHPKGLIHGGDDICGGESLLDFSRSTRKARDEEENCLVGAVWTLAWVPATARVHQTRPGSAPKEGTLEEEAGDL